MRLTRTWRLTTAGAIVLALVAILAVVPLVSARGNVGTPVKAGTTNHTLTVAGHGEARVPPDEATMTLGVESKGQDAQTALSDNASKMNAVVQAVKAQGVPSNHIQTSQLSIWYDSEHNVYIATHQITVHIDNVDKTGQVLDAAVGAGANNSWGVNFGLKDPSAARGEALKAAVADARKRASSMASALGVTITGVGSASEATYQYVPPEPIAATGVRGVAPAPTPVQPGELTVTGDISVVFTFG